MERGAGEGGGSKARRQSTFRLKVPCSRQHKRLRGLGVAPGGETGLWWSLQLPGREQMKRNIGDCGGGEGLGSGRLGQMGGRHEAFTCPQ